MILMILDLGMATVQLGVSLWEAAAFSDKKSPVGFLLGRAETTGVV